MMKLQIEKQPAETWVQLQLQKPFSLHFPQCNSLLTPVSVGAVELMLQALFKQWRTAGNQSEDTNKDLNLEWSGVCVWGGGSYHGPWYDLSAFLHTVHSSKAVTWFHFMRRSQKLEAWNLTQFLLHVWLSFISHSAPMNTHINTAML